MESGIVEASTKRAIENFIADLKDLILESVLTQIVKNLELKQLFQKEWNRQG